MRKLVELTVFVINILLSLVFRGSVGSDELREGTDDVLRWGLDEDGPRHPGFVLVDSGAVEHGLVFAIAENLELVANVDDEGVGNIVDIVPKAVPGDLKARNIVGNQDGEEAQVGVSGDPQSHVRPGAWGIVIDLCKINHIISAGSLVEPLVGYSQSLGPTLEQLLCHPSQVLCVLFIGLPNIYTIN